MKRLSLILLALLCCNLAIAQKPKKAAKPITVLSVADILSNYGLDSAMVNDTANVMLFLDQQPQDFVALTNLCVSIRTKAQKALSSIENDYPFRDSLVWIDSNTVLGDYAIYEYRLRSLADYMGRLSIRYSRLEQQRVEAEKEAARQRALEEARLQQERRDKTADDLRSNIDLHHRAIITACDGKGITDKAKLKELKDIYYSYLMVYNKYDLSSGRATDESIMRLDELNAFQNDMLENVLGNNSLPYQIENFKNVLKVRCEKGNSDIYRSYSRVFKNTSVPVSFADIKEYEEYINRMHTVINVQSRYLQTIELRAAIASGTDAIVNLYGKKYRDMLGAYKDVAKSINQLPSFTTNAESILFIENLEKFIEAQQIYQDNYSMYEELSARSDTIIRGSRSKFYDVVVAYRNIQSMLHPLPSFKDRGGAVLYDAELDEVRNVQQSYMDVISLRHVIARNEDTLTTNRKLDRTLSNGYKLLSRQVDLKPNFSTVERGRSFINMLNTYIEMQRTCLEALHKLERIKQNEKTITGKENPYRNIIKAYNRIEKSYHGIDEIANTEDLRRYNRQCTYILEMQEAFLNAIHNPDAASIDTQLKKVSELDKIQLIVGIK